MAAKANIIVDQATTFSTQLVITDDNDLPIDLTGYTIHSQLKKWYTSSTYVEFDIEVPRPQNGIVNLNLTANTTANLEYGRYVYDIIAVKNNDGTITRIIEGILTVTPEVTYLD